MTVPGAAVTTDHKPVSIGGETSSALNWCPIAEQDQLTLTRNIKLQKINTTFPRFILQNSHEIEKETKKTNRHACTRTQEYLHTGGKRRPADETLSFGLKVTLASSVNSPIHRVKLGLLNGITGEKTTVTTLKPKTGQKRQQHVSVKRRQARRSKVPQTRRVGKERGRLFSRFRTSLLHQSRQIQSFRQEVNGGKTQKILLILNIIFNENVMFLNVLELMLKRK